ncbi:MAG: ThiF family adenylyltransferase [archaeon]
MTELEIDIYDRQRRIPGWNQDTLTNSLVTIVGSSHLALETAIPLAALGVGNIVIIGDERTKRGEKVLDIDIEPRKYRVNEWEKALKTIFPKINILPINASIESKTNVGLAEGDVVVETTNSARSKINVLRNDALHSDSMFFGSTITGYLKVMPIERNDSELRFKNDYTIPNFNGLPQDEFTSIIAGGILAEEVKKRLFRSEFNIDQPVYLKIGNQDRIGYLKDGESFKKHPSFAGKKALVVGNGALLASGAGRILAKQGYESIDLMDMDYVDETNLNRQILHYNGVGKLKVQSAAEVLKKIGNNDTMYNTIDQKFDEKFKSDVDYDVIFDWVDNLYTRALVSIYAIRNQIPLITAATDHKSGEWATYVPGKTKCMDHYFGVHSMGAEEERIRRHSCTQAPNPSVITSNQITGSASALEAGTVFNPEVYGEPINGILKYSSTRGRKLGITTFKDSCDCHTKKVPDLVVEKEVAEE